VDYSVIDNSMLLNFIFFPRKDLSPSPPGTFDLMVPVEEGVEIHCRAYPADSKESPWLLYFHGNGEIVSDYNFLAPYYQKEGISLFVADYRGYGRSSGTPTITGMIEDAPRILEAVKKELRDRGWENKNLWAMGRSLGSVSVLELADRHPGDIKGIIVESGFISVVNLLRCLGVPLPGDISPLEEKDQQKASRISLPALVIHGEIDNLVPLEKGEELYRVLASGQKKLFTIPLGDHNNVFFVETRRYLEEIKKFMGGVKY